MVVRVGSYASDARGYPQPQVEVGRGRAGGTTAEREERLGADARDDARVSA